LVILYQKQIDRGAIELLGPYGLAKTFTETGTNIAKLDTGIITTYSLYITIGLLLLIFLVFSPVLVDINYNEWNKIIHYIFCFFNISFISF